MLSFVRETSDSLSFHSRQLCKKCDPHSDSRLPITLPILFRLVDSLDHILKAPVGSPAVFSYVYLIAFLRVGEMTANPGPMHNALTVDHYQPVPDTYKLRVHFTHYKQGKRPASIIIEPQAKERCCQCGPDTTILPRSMGSTRAIVFQCSQTCFQLTLPQQGLQQL